MFPEALLTSSELWHSVFIYSSQQSNTLVKASTIDSCHLTHKVMKIQKEKGIWLIFTGSQRNSRVGSRVPLARGRWPVLIWAGHAGAALDFSAVVSMLNLKELRVPGGGCFQVDTPQRTSHTSYASQRHITPRHLMPSQKPGHCGIQSQLALAPWSKAVRLYRGSQWVLPKEDAATLSPGRLSF